MEKEKFVFETDNALELTANQKKAFQNFCKFIADDSLKVFILKGYAGTGKTTLIRYFIQEIAQHDNTRCVLVVSENLPLLGCSTTYHPITCKILFRETNPRGDKNGTEPQENKIKNALLRISVSEYLLLRCKGTNLSRQKRIKTHKVHIYSAFFIFLYHGG